MSLFKWLLTSIFGWICISLIITTLGLSYIYFLNFSSESDELTIAQEINH